MIERLYAHNYRTLENFTIDFAGRPSALMIGRNGAGKSTVLECLRVFQRIGRGSSRTRDLISVTDFAQHRTNLPMRLAIELTLKGGFFRYEIAFEWPPKFREARVLEEVLSRDGAEVFRRQHSKIQLAGGALFDLDWHTLALPVINERPGERATIPELKAFLAAMMLIAPVPARMTGFSEEPSAELDDDAANFGACLRGLLGQKPAAYALFVEELRAVMPDFASYENPERGERGTQLIVTFEGKDVPGSLAVEFKALSDGEKCFFLAAYIVTANRAGSPVFCMWDEPDNHLSLSEVGQLVLSLRKLANRGGQFVATSHHPETIRKFSDEATLVLTRRSHLEPTIVRPLAEMGYKGDLVRALIRDEIIG
jgi:ABC-type cobalamin/Fe3+-siderophores transport system ATPase subunit